MEANSVQTLLGPRSRFTTLVIALADGWPQCGTARIVVWNLFAVWLLNDKNSNERTLCPAVIYSKTESYMHCVYF